ncbi:hypothetical protein BC351_21490 [Paenibacillus ferrarius]|uniref:DNA-binding response regulator n=1 Tax=Paenibacillus ferrarius TaxID=1469647 RepID=A0A1V4HN50_9BACL|nr:response regulator [Paenibacillus ferrarius]OPH58918.1 hypothetical protein BC351_21490 [Paenibacillus ferrarius]
MLNAMIVEDNAIYRYAIKSIIRWEDYGFQIVSEALNGVHALDLLQHQHVDLIVTDISMPEMNGIDLIQQVKQQDASIKIVALSSFDDFRFVKEALKLGAEDYLLKHDLEPDTLQQLLQQMNVKILQDHEQSKQANIREANLQEMRCILGRKLLFGELKTIQEMEDQASAVRFPKVSGPTVVMIIDGEFKPITPIPSSEMPNEQMTVTIPISNQRTVIVAAFPHEKSERKCSEEAFRQVSNMVNRSKEEGSLTVGISLLGYGLKDWPTLYKQAERALEQSIYEGLGQIYTYAGKNAQGAEPERDSLLMQKLAAAMRSGFVADVEAQTELFFQSLNQRKPPLAQLKQLFMELTGLVTTIARERGTLSEKVELACRQINHMIETLPSLPLIKQKILALNKEVACSPVENPLLRKEIQAAIAYIEQHYAEDITVAQVADVLHLSSNYLSNLFKMETGMRFVEYVNRCRIRKAKLLLRDVSLKVYEVAEKTGFQETSYFCKVFKELEGKTVKEYRCEC